MVILNVREESPTRTALELEVPASDVEKAFSEVTRAYAKRASIPGFRKGHVPEGVVRQRFGDQIRDDVLESLLPDVLHSAIEERGLAILGSPRVEDLQWDPPGAIRFTARLDLKPEVDPGEWRGIPVEGRSVEPTEAEVAGVIERLRESHAEFHPIEGRAAAPGDYAVADVVGTFVEILAPGQNPRTFRDEKLTLEVGHPDSMPEINEALRGLLPGQTQRFRKAFPDDFPNEEFRGKTVDYELTLVALKEKRLPELTEDFARAVGDGETLNGLREKVRQGLRQEKEAERRRRFRRTILDTLLSRVSIPAPELLAESETEGALRDYARYLAASGVDPKSADWEKLRLDARPGAEKRVREYLLLDAIARREGIEVTDTELEAEFKRTAARRGEDPAALRQKLVQAGGLESLRDEMRLSKVVDLLISAAQVLPSGEPVAVE